MNTIIYGPRVTPGELALSVLQAEGDVREDTPEGRERIGVYLRCCKLDPAKRLYPWCAACVTWAIREAGLRLSMLKFRGSSSVSTMLARNAKLVIPVSEARTGDVLIRIGRSGNHCGLFVKRATVKPGILSHEGNTDKKGSRTGGRLMAKRRAESYWTHAIRVA